MCFFFFFKQKTAYELRISDWSSDVCSSDLAPEALPPDADDPLVGAPRDRSEGMAAVARDLLRSLIGPLLAILTALIVGALIIVFTDPTTLDEIGRASCRERVDQYV